MHSSPPSASSQRERRRAETTSGLVDEARRLTAAGGLQSFTIDELCLRVGIARRTFFNYFSSKEDAVLGVTSLYDAEVLERDFVEAVARDGARAGLSETLLDEVIELDLARSAAFDLTAENGPHFIAALEREPRLLERIATLSKTSETRDVALVEEREGLPSGDLRARAVVRLAGMIVGSALLAHFDSPDDDVRTFVDAHLAAYREAAQLTSH